MIVSDGSFLSKSATAVNVTEVNLSCLALIFGTLSYPT